MTKPKQNNPNPTKTSTGYRFATIDPDPDTLVIRDLIINSPLTIPQIAAAAMISYQTVDRIFELYTKRPHNATITKILIALGFERHIKRLSNSRQVAVQNELVNMKGNNVYSLAKITGNEIDPKVLQEKELRLLESLIKRYPENAKVMLGIMGEKS